MRALGIILTGGSSTRMGDLANKRATAALPMAGGYRAIDFALSNMTNSHINKVAVFTQFNAKSLNEHLCKGVKRLIMSPLPFVVVVPLV